MYHASSQDLYVVVVSLGQYTIINANVDITLKKSKGQTARNVAIDESLHRIAMIVDLEASDGTLSSTTRDEQEDDDNINIGGGTCLKVGGAEKLLLKCMYK